MTLHLSCEFTGQPHWEAAGVADKIDLRIGPASETLSSHLEVGAAVQNRVAEKVHVVIGPDADPLVLAAPTGWRRFNFWAGLHRLEIAVL